MKRRHQLITFVAYPVSAALIYLILLIGASISDAQLRPDLVQHWIMGLVYCYATFLIGSFGLIFGLVGILMIYAWWKCVYRYSRELFILANIGSFAFFVLPIILLLTGMGGSGFGP
jgi:hypothetical protein